ncbi:hypothetical protein TRAPUB_10981 [Trametes pubescens]|uniref:Uncharacterized protein n=1 Tax=Trametes pubescens TaxID=154538 RepID=A0A1M2VY22_TRAPU|nr:hypothetical protein TRAPUB_10981 [Trametes pubescens]
MAFSPWDAAVGEPIRALNFQLEESIRAVVTLQEEAALIDSDEDDQPDLAPSEEPSASEGPAPVSDTSGSTLAIADAPNAPALSKPAGHSPKPVAARAPHLGDAIQTRVSDTNREPSGDHAGSAEMSKEKYHSKQHSKARRRTKRAVSAAFGEPGISKRPVKAIAAKRRSAAAVLASSIDLGADIARALQADNKSTTAADAQPIDTQFSLAMDDVRVATTAYVGKRERNSEAEKASASTPITKEDLIARDFEYIPWDGRCAGACSVYRQRRNVDHRQCRPILDKNGRVFAVLAGRPRDPSWDQVNSDLQAIFDTTRGAYSLEPKQLQHRRGAFPAISSGISYGGGQKHVMNLSQKTQSNQAVMDSLLAQTAVRRVANFGNSALQLFAPRLYEHYNTTLYALCDKYPELQPNFPNNVFGSATFNLGPRTVSYVHADQQNLPHGWCAITAVGDYDPVAGGHIILWELQMVVEFPPGSTILIPSAIIRHSNTVISPDEHRYSFTQYTAGGLFRWVECGFKPVKALTPKEAKKYRNGHPRWERGLAAKVDNCANTQLLRRARNQRYQQKLKLRVAAPPARTFSRGSPIASMARAATAPGADIYSHAQIRLPVTPDALQRGELERLNASLASWGCPDDPRAFVEELDNCLQEASQDTRTRTEWVAHTEEWVLAGDPLLDSIQAFIVSGCMASLCPEELGRVWGEISAVVFKVQYVMAAVEVRLDGLLVSP